LKKHSEGSTAAARDSVSPIHLDTFEDGNEELSVSLVASERCIATIILERCTDWKNADVAAMVSLTLTGLVALGDRGSGILDSYMYILTKSWYIWYILWYILVLVRLEQLRKFNDRISCEGDSAGIVDGLWEDAAVKLIVYAVLVFKIKEELSGVKSKEGLEPTAAPVKRIKSLVESASAWRS